LDFTTFFFLNHFNFTLQVLEFNKKFLNFFDTKNSAIKQCEGGTLPLS